ncbi:unnamed protein product [Peronospora belbahrii]|uniref:Tyrosine-protein kinase ephrin type A/B receptor-like domain-containing protein n=1 Tax=Peronospora belbahrii TaxID=622444 RepID=A0ABN8D5E6_9STRA|nr:unnamed protein product [Peronospora belbahrii]
MKMWKLYMMLFLMLSKLIKSCANSGIVEMFSPFIDLEALAEEAAKGNVAAQPVDTSYPLASVESNALMQIYRDCRSQQSTGLRTWCIGNNENVFSDEDSHEPCPRGILTDPCTGRVLHSNRSANIDDVEFLWPWKGIRCDPYTEPTTVTHIYLPRESLKCEIAKVDLSVMVSLEQLDLSYNQLYGELPAWLGDMTVLRLLNVAENNLTGDIPTSFAGNDALELIILSGNGLSASTVHFFDAFHRLQYLDLSSNKFAIELSRTLFSSPFLRTIHNAFYGQFIQLPILHFLETFDVSSNLLMGSVPLQISSWGREDPHDPDEISSLITLNLSNNFFTGTLPLLSNQSVLQQLDVHNNLFSGVLPDFPSSLLDFIKPSMFDGNAFLCPMPTALLPSNLTCVCGDGHTITSDIVESSRHDKGAKRVFANQAIDLCVPCGEGLFSNATTNHKCVACPVGAVPSSKGYYCKPCLPGSFSNASGTQFCSPCSPGTFAAGNGTTSCSACNPGQFAAKQGWTKCLECPVGTFSRSKGETVCTPCPAGTYASAQGEAECLMCSKGTYQDVAGSTECKACPRGYIAPHHGHVKCLPCSPGSFYDTIRITCTLCRPGTFTGTPAQTECIKCDNGTVAEGYGNDKCLHVASPGFGYSVTGTALKCEPGTYNDGAWRTCQPCPRGTFAAGIGSRMCLSCAKGSFAFNKGSSYCAMAPSGSFVPLEGAVRAELCPPNHITATTGSITCIQCTLPSFSFLPGGTRCIHAKLGEAYEHVKWPRLVLDLVGVEQHELLTKRGESLPLDVLIQTWTDTLTNSLGFTCNLHVLQVHQPPESSSFTKIIVAVEMETTLLSPMTDLDPRLVMKGGRDDQDRATKTVINALDELLNEFNGSNDDGKEFDGDQVMTDLISLQSFQDTLVRQWHHMESVTSQMSSLNLVNISIDNVPFVSTRAVACRAGTFSIVLDTSERTCQACPKGFYSFTTGALECTPCPQGTYSAATGSTICNLCPSGADAAPGAHACVECLWFTYACQGFWQDLMIASGITIGLIWILYNKIHRICMGNGAQQEQDDERMIALMTAVRTHGRTLDRVRYAPMGEISADTIQQLARKSKGQRTQAAGNNNWGKSFGQRAEMDSVPLFEREHRNDSQLVQRLQNELADAKRFVEAQARRQNDLEYVNEDLERRLEQEALDRIALDSQKAEDEKRWQEEKAALQKQLESWEARFEEETRRRAMAEERLRRAEKELYRMHQKKYDIEKQVRREENEKRKHEAVIVRTLQSDSQRAQQSAANGVLDPTVNPKDTKPAAVRTRQALSSAMDFLGV